MEAEGETRGVALVGGDRVGDRDARPDGDEDGEPVLARGVGDTVPLSVAPPLAVVAADADVLERRLGEPPDDAVAHGDAGCDAEGAALREAVTDGDVRGLAEVGTDCDGEPLSDAINDGEACVVADNRPLALTLAQSEPCDVAVAVTDGCTLALTAAPVAVATPLGVGAALADLTLVADDPRDGDAAEDAESATAERVGSAPVALAGGEADAGADSDRRPLDDATLLAVALAQPERDGAGESVARADGEAGDVGEGASLALVQDDALRLTLARLLALGEPLAVGTAALADAVPQPVAPADAETPAEALADAQRDAEADARVDAEVEGDGDWRADAETLNDAAIERDPRADAEAERERDGEGEAVRVAAAIVGEARGERVAPPDVVPAALAEGQTDADMDADADVHADRAPEPVPDAVARQPDSLGAGDGDDESLPQPPVGVGTAVKDAAALSLARGDALAGPDRVAVPPDGVAVGGADALAQPLPTAVAVADIEARTPVAETLPVVEPHALTADDGELVATAVEVTEKRALAHAVALGEAPPLADELREAEVVTDSEALARPLRDAEALADTAATLPDALPDADAHLVALPLPPLEAERLGDAEDDTLTLGTLLGEPRPGVADWLPLVEGDGDALAD